jgi:hypothetical protein
MDCNYEPSQLLGNRIIDIQGTIEIRIEDKYGNVKHRSKTKNTITRAALTQILASGLSNTAGLQNVFGTGFGRECGQIVTPLPGALGIYCMSRPICVSPCMIYRSYLNTAQSKIQSGSVEHNLLVPFYNDAPEIDGSTPEMPYGLERVSTMCRMTSTGSVVYTFEYRNPVGDGIAPSNIGGIQSVIIGQSPRQLSKSPIGVMMTLPIEKFPSDPNTDELTVFAPGYALFHTTTFGVPTTYVFKQVAQKTNTSMIYGVCSRTYKRTEEVFQDFLVGEASAGVSWSGGLIISPSEGDVKYALVKVAFSDATDTVESEQYINPLSFTLYYKYGELDGLTAHTPLHLMFSDTALKVGERFGTPVMVDRGAYLEIFVSGGSNDDCSNHINLWRMRILKEHICDGYAHVTEWDFVGCLPYVIGSKTSKTADNGYFTGYWDDVRKEYYLPVSKHVSGSGLVEFGHEITVLGVLLRDSGRLMHAGDVRGLVIFASNYTFTDVNADSYCGSYVFTAGMDHVKQMVVVGTADGKTMCDVVIDTVWSCANLGVPIIKEADDLLRVIYSYELGYNIENNYGTCPPDQCVSGGDVEPEPEDDMQWLVIDDDEEFGGEGCEMEWLIIDDDGISGGEGCGINWQIY